MKKEEFINKKIYITGATGLIGSNLVNELLKVNGIDIILQVRNEEKAKKLFGKRVKYEVCDLLDTPKYEGDVDYIVHCANPTSSQFFVNNPVETINLAVNGTIRILEFAKKKKVDGFVFLSTMEVYGYPERGHKVKENEGGSFDSSVVRNCYPLSKQTCESLCAAYASEYGVPTRVLRLTQTFGPGVDYNDGRVFAEFARCAIEKKDIILMTKGETEREYLYTLDAVSAILTVLLNGKDGEVYTAANEDTFCSIYEMAKMVADMSGINVIIKEQNIEKLGYANTLHMDLDTSKLKALGWKPDFGLKEMYINLLESLKKKNKEFF
nr:NAD(P)-dependent oxidoreductase [uncultured Blautia sp.]